MRRTSACIVREPSLIGALSRPNSTWAFPITMNSKYAPYNHVRGEVRAARGGLIKRGDKGSSTHIMRNTPYAPLGAPGHPAFVAIKCVSPDPEMRRVTRPSEAAGELPDRPRPMGATAPQRARDRSFRENLGRDYPISCPETTVLGWRATSWSRRQTGQENDALRAVITV